MRYFSERLDAGALQFEVLIKLPHIKEEMWKHNSGIGPYVVSRLLDRLFLLFAMAGLVIENHYAMMSYLKDFL
jgi:hypothetical protein